MKKLLFFTLLIILATPFPTFAHKVSLFCYRENDTVHGEGFFSQGSPVKNSTVEIYDLNTDTLVVTTKTDDEGMFSVPVHGTDNIKVVLVASMGHRAEYLLTETTALEEPSGKETVVDSVRAPLDYEKIAEIVQKEIQPLHDELRRLEKQQSGPNVGEIVGGLGWIVGLFSLLYLLRKKNAS